jgi:hypothetical protein
MNTCRCLLRKDRFTYLCIYLKILIQSKVFLLFAVLGIELRASFIVGIACKDSIHQALLFVFLFFRLGLANFVWAGLELVILLSILPSNQGCRSMPPYLTQHVFSFTSLRPRLIWESYF